MRIRSLVLGIVLALSAFALPRSAYACPSSQVALPNTSGSEEDDQLRLARAYNHSIYLMAGMPYLLLGVFGFLIYRGLRQKPRDEMPPTGDL